MSDKPVEDKPVKDRSLENKPVEDKPLEDKLVDDRPVENRPLEDKPVENQVLEDDAEQGAAQQKADQPDSRQTDKKQREAPTLNNNEDSSDKGVYEAETCNEGKGNDEGNDNDQEILSSIISTPPETKRGRKGIIILVILMILGWLAIAAAGYWYHLFLDKKQQRLNGQLMTMAQGAIKNTKQKLSDLDKNITAVHTDVTRQLQSIEQEATGDLRALNAQVKEHEARLNGQQERLASLSTTSKEDWLLAEAEYLLKLANQRVLMEQTPHNVVALLTRADNIIERVAAGLGDRELFAIRKLLAEEITALKLITPIDTQGVYLRLGALADVIHTLPTLPTSEERFQQEENTVAPAEDGFFAEFKREMANVFDFIRHSFSIKSEDALANPIVSQQRLQLMQLNTRLFIEQAQISLLKAEAVSYQASLQAAIELSRRYFFESPAREKFAEELAELAKKEIVQELPDISKSLKLLHNYVAVQHRMSTPTAGTEARVN